MLNVGWYVFSPSLLASWETWRMVGTFEVTHWRSGPDHSIFTTRGSMVYLQVLSRSSIGSRGNGAKVALYCVWEVVSMNDDCRWMIGMPEEMRKSSAKSYERAESSRMMSTAVASLPSDRSVSIFTRIDQNAS